MKYIVYGPRELEQNWTVETLFARYENINFLIVFGSFTFIAIVTYIIITVIECLYKRKLKKYPEKRVSSTINVFKIVHHHHVSMKDQPKIKALNTVSATASSTNNTDIVNDTPNDSNNNSDNNESTKLPATLEELETRLSKEHVNHLKKNSEDEIVIERRHTQLQRSNGKSRGQLKREEWNPERKKYYMISVIYLAAYFGSVGFLMLKQFLIILNIFGFPEFLKQWSMYLMLSLFLLFGNILLEYFRQRSLKLFNSLYVIPIFQVKLIVIGTIFGGLYFNEFISVTTTQLTIFFISVGITACGVFILTFANRLNALALGQNVNIVKRKYLKGIETLPKVPLSPSHSKSKSKRIKSPKSKSKSNNTTINIPNNNTNNSDDNESNNNSDNNNENINNGISNEDNPIFNFKTESIPNNLNTNNNSNPNDISDDDDEPPPLNLMNSIQLSIQQRRHQRKLSELSENKITTQDIDIE